uniref:RxLR effector candidate protein n=1 Tax=Hyaloperonospora arabidopsidis (strain Emoy2) TaxID=559515 RepID=M4B551_HYAAE
MAGSWASAKFGLVILCQSSCTSTATSPSVHNHSTTEICIVEVCSSDSGSWELVVVHPSGS